MAFDSKRMTGGGGMTTVQTLKAVCESSLRRIAASAAAMAIAILVQLNCVSPAHAVLEVDVTRGVVQPLPVAITDFSGAQPDEIKVGQDIAQVITSNLRNYSTGTHEVMLAITLGKEPVQVSQP